MEPQLQHPQVHRYGEDHHHHHHLADLEGEASEDQQRHGEKSVLNKVKEKAKKIKESIKEHVHDLHGHEQHDNYDQDQEHENDLSHVVPLSHKFDHLATDDTVDGHQQTTEIIEDRIRHDGQRLHGLAAKGCTEEVPVAARNTPVNRSTNWAEKLRPGDEDRALSQVISDTMNNNKVREERKIPVKERVSNDAVYKRASEENNKEDDRNDNEVNLMGKVTESEEVAKRLGTSEEEKRGEVTNINPTGMEGPVREWIKETVSSWWKDASK